MDKKALQFYLRLERQFIALHFLSGVVTRYIDDGNVRRNPHVYEQLETQLLELKAMAKEALAGTDLDKMRQALDACKASEFLQKRLLGFLHDLFVCPPRSLESLGQMKDPDGVERLVFNRHESFPDAPNGNKGGHKHLVFLPFQKRVLR